MTYTKSEPFNLAKAVVAIQGTLERISAFPEAGPGSCQSWVRVLRTKLMSDFRAQFQWKEVTS